MEAVFEDWRTAPVGPELRAALGFVEALSLRPDRIEAEADIRPLREQGLSDEDIENVAAICAAFHVIVRIADALDFEVPTEEEFARLAPKMAARGYG